MDGSRTDLLVIHPGADGVYGELRDNLVAVEPPLWARLIAGYVRDRGFSVQLLDAEAVHATPDEIAGYVSTVRPRLVCLAVYGHQPSASTQQMHAAGLTARAIKQEPNAPPIIMVGGHVSALPEQTMREEAIDYACVGEGPITIIGLLKWLQPVAQERGTVYDILGLVHRNTSRLSIYGSIIVNDSAPLIEDLSQLHGNVWDLLPMAAYRSHNWQVFGDMSKRQPYASIYTTLGCPFACSFCCIAAPFRGASEKSDRSYRMRKPIDVVDEIVMLYRDGVKTFKITDEMFVLNERHYTAICNYLIASGIADDINIWAYSRVDTVRPDTLALLRRAGIRWLALGIESASAYVRDGAQKRFKNNDIVDVVRTIQAADINVIGNFIFGLPDDNMDTMHDTLRLALELNCEFANFYSAMAYPGSPLYLEAISKGWNLPASWKGYSQHNYECRPLDTLYLDAATVLKFRDEAFNIYFRNPRYLEMVKRKFGSETLQHVKNMTKYQLKRKLIEQRYVPAEMASSQ